MLKRRQKSSPRSPRLGRSEPSWSLLMIASAWNLTSRSVGGPGVGRTNAGVIGVMGGRSGCGVFGMRGDAGGGGTLRALLGI